QENISLKPFHTFGVEARARYYTCIQDIPTFQQLLHRPELQALPKLILGSGSNILFTQDFPGWVIQVGFHAIEKIKEDATSVCIKAGGGRLWHELVMYAVQQNYAGIENLSLIPGTVGGAPIQNIGAYGVELSEVLEYVEAIEINTGKMRIFSNSDCQFGYRESIFKNELKNQYIILSVTLCLQKLPTFRIEYGAIKETLDAMQVKELSIKAISEAIIRIRQSKLPDPTTIGNAGSFFKNPVVDQETLEKIKIKYPDLVYHDLPNKQAKIFAAWLIEKSGWKGYRSGQVGVHPNHALILVNYGSATGQAIDELAQKIQQSVQAKFGINLVPEVNII
ncbi:MAG: UDP-N-acetylmuramate dehydrogenase, partial [Burkholderiales bacterium]